MLQARVANICFKCFIYILQVFYVDVVKVDRDVAYITMVIHVCCERLFQMFQLVQTYVARVLSVCCICFTLMLLVFHPDVVYVSHICCKCFI